MFGVYVSDDVLVYVAQNEEEANRVSSRFYENRTLNSDCYTVYPLHVFDYIPTDIESEYSHQVFPRNNGDEHLCYLFLGGPEWYTRGYYTPEYVRSFNETHPAHTCLIRAESESEAEERYHYYNQIKTRSSYAASSNHQFTT